MKIRILNRLILRHMRIERGPLRWGGLTYQVGHVPLGSRFGKNSGLRRVVALGCGLVHRLSLDEAQRRGFLPRIAGSGPALGGGAFRRG